MIKTILPSSFGYNDALVSMVDVHQTGIDTAWMQKRAAAGVFRDTVIKPEKGQAFIHLIAMGDSESWGCFFEGAPVITAKGIVPIDKVQIGDYVLTHKNRYRKVITTYCTAYEGNQIDLDLRGVPAGFSCTPNHPVLVVPGNKLDAGRRWKLRNSGELSSDIDQLVTAAEFIAAENIQPEDFVVMPCQAYESWIPPVEFDPYVAGVYVAEGCLAKEYKPECKATVGTYAKLIFTLSDQDEAVIAYIDQWLIGLGRQPVAHGRSYTSEYGVRLELGMIALAPVFDDLFGHMSNDKFLSPKIFSLSREQKLKFLAGYLDGDGCVMHGDDRYTGTVKVSTASLSLAMDIQRLLGSIGISSSIGRCWNRACNGCFGQATGDHVIYQINIGSRQSNIILEHCLRLKPTAHAPVGRGGGSMQVGNNYLLIPVSQVIRSVSTHVVKYNIEVEEDHSYVVNGCSVGNSNRNGDIFKKQAGYENIPHPEDGKTKKLWISKGNRETHQTFETHGKVFRNHKNKDPKQAEGSVVKSAHNDDMNRVELIIKVPEATWGDDLEKLARGGDVPFSMSCRIPADFCSACGHRSRTRAEYCDHLKNHMGEITKEGHAVGAINDNMVYFDISRVVVPADRTAYGLLKVAAVGDRVIGGAELSEDMVLFPPDDVEDLVLGSRKLAKLTMIRKLAEIEKEIEASTADTEKERMAFDPEVCPDIPDSDMKKLDVPVGQRGDLLGAMADVRISLSLSDFLRIILGNRFGEIAGEIEPAKKLLPGMFNRLTKSPASATNAFDHLEFGNSVLPREARETIHRLMAGHSMEDEPVSRRITIAVLRGKSSPALRSAGLEKDSGAVSVLADRIATAYAMYKVAYCQSVGDTDWVSKFRAVLQNYV